MSQDKLRRDLGSLECSSKGAVTCPFHTLD